MSVNPVNWIPGTLNGAFPFFSVQSNTLYFRADDVNIYGINFGGGVTTLPSVYYATDPTPVRAGNQGRNFYSAPWAIPTLPARDTGKRVEVTVIDPSIYSYIHSFYTLLTTDPSQPEIPSVNLQDFSLVQSGWARQYQLINRNQTTHTNGILYFGANTTGVQETSLGGVASSSMIQSPNISETQSYTYDGSLLPTWQQPYNTFYAIDTPIVFSAIDVNNNNTLLYFTFENTAQVYNNNI